MMFFALALIVTAVSEPAGPKVAPQELRYAAYWLSEQGGDSEYRKLLLVRIPLYQLSKRMELEEWLASSRPERVPPPPPPPILDCAALTISTYQKDSIWNQDGRSLKPLTRFRGLNERDQTVEVNGVRCRYEECSLADVVRLLKTPEGKIPIHRLRAPLAGMEQSGRVLRLLVEEQLKNNESRKK